MSDATSVTTSKSGRLPNPQPNDYLPKLDVEVFLGGEALGAITVPQDTFLSKNGNVLYRAIIRKGLRLPGEVADVLNALTYKVNGEDAAITARGIHTSAPRIDKADKVVPNTGGDPMVTHFAMVEVADDTQYMLLIVVKHLGVVKGTDQGYQLRVQANPRAVGVPGVDIGEVTGLLIG